MNLELWQDLVASHRESLELITHAAPEAAANDLDAMRVVVGPEAMEQLHGQLRQTLGRLASKLGTSLESGDIKQVLFVLAIQLDEKVQRRLAPDEAPRWPLLQRALFDVHDGGDMFYDLIDDRMARRDSPELQLVFEVCYFCLSDGFVGRHSRNKPMIEEYKRKLSSRIARPTGNESEDRTIAYMGPVNSTRIPSRYWLYSAGALLLLPLLLLLVW
jgi:type IV/VI secretion system ImpK/VasF family protein